MLVVNSVQPGAPLYRLPQLLPQCGRRPPGRRTVPSSTLGATALAYRRRTLGHRTVQHPPPHPLSRCAPVWCCYGAAEQCRLWRVRGRGRGRGNLPERVLDRGLSEEAGMRLSHRIAPSHPQSWSSPPPAPRWACAFCFACVSFLRRRRRLLRLRLLLEKKKENASPASPSGDGVRFLLHLRLLLEKACAFCFACVSFSCTSPCFLLRRRLLLAPILYSLLLVALDFLYCMPSSFSVSSLALSCTLFSILAQSSQR